MIIALTIFFSVLIIFLAYYVGNRAADSFDEDIVIQVTSTLLGCLIIGSVLTVIAGIFIGVYALISPLFN